MKKINTHAFRFMAILFLLSFTGLPSKKKINLWLCGDSTMSIKEPKAFPETGWGMPFVYFWDTSVNVKNLAKNGRSTKTFISEGLWKSVIDNAKEGDYVFIQFGHNDESPDKKERYATPDTFKMNLNRFINEARSKNAIPVFFTPVSRRKFDTAGRALETHKVYSNLVKEVAKSQDVIFIDLDTKSRTLYQQFGKENSKLLFMQLKKGEHPNYPEGRDDNTHFNELGARLIAQLVLQEIRLQIPELAERIIIPAVKK
jgi:lysophospholipase L1-like esterase